MTNFASPRGVVLLTDRVRVTRTCPTRLFGRLDFPSGRTSAAPCLTAPRTDLKRLPRLLLRPAALRPPPLCRRYRIACVEKILERYRAKTPRGPTVPGRFPAPTYRQSIPRLVEPLCESQRGFLELGKRKSLLRRNRHFEYWRTWVHSRGSGESREKWLPLEGWSVTETKYQFSSPAFETPP